jgi:orotidine-5'-phosphate decarboxylase
MFVSRLSASPDRLRASADAARTFAACPGRVMPSASRLLLSAGPDVGALRDAAAALAAEFRAALPATRLDG